MKEARTPPTREFSCKCHFFFLVRHRIACETHFNWDCQRAWLCSENHTRVFNSARADKHLFMEFTKKCATLLFSYQRLTRVHFYTITVSMSFFNVVLWPLWNRIKPKHARFKDNIVCLILYRKINIFGKKTIKRGHNSLTEENEYWHLRKSFAKHVNYN